VRLACDLGFGSGCVRRAHHTNDRVVASGPGPRGAQTGLTLTQGVTVLIDGHNVDGLTGANGHPAETYLAKFFDFPDELTLEEIDKGRLEELCQ
jgi:hypothetical protein